MADKDEVESFQGSFFLPDDKEEWRELVAKARLGKKTIHDITKMASGSKLLKRQFLMLRVLWPKRKDNSKFELEKEEYGLDAGTWKSATETINQSSEFKQYLNLLETRFNIEDMVESDAPWAGSFMPVIRFQNKCAARKPGAREAQQPKTRGFLKRKASASEDRQSDQGVFKAEDEAVVNTALILFLDAIANLRRSLAVEWTMTRFTFKPSFLKSTFTALTDGALRDLAKRWVRGLVEVKKVQRDDSIDGAMKIAMQESGETVGWVMSNQSTEGPFKNHRLVVSQNADEVYLTFGKEDPGYHEYLESGNVARGQDPFLRMQSYGPWRIRNPAHMRQLGIAILAITLLANGASGAGGDPGAGGTGGDEGDEGRST